MHQTICQKCKTVNRSDAVVCTRCGTKLAHRERNVISQIRHSAVGKNIATAPKRLAKWICQKVFYTLLTLFVLIIIGLCGIFIPLSWEEYQKPDMPAANDSKVRQQTYILFAGGGSFSAEVQDLGSLGQFLIFNPAFGARRSPGKTQTLGKAGEGVKYFTVVKLPNDRFALVLYQKFYNKVPFRMQAVFVARRELKGRLELESCRVGNLPVSANILKTAAAKLLTAWNPDQKFTLVFDRIYRAEMELDRNGSENKLKIYVRKTNN